MAALKLKGYVLLESMIAMIIVMMCFGFSVMIYNTVVMGTQNKLKVLARICLENEAIKSKKQNRLVDEDADYNEFRIEKRISSFANSETIFLLHCSAITPGGIVLAEYKEIIHAQ
jgi:hypothetical protein